MENTIEMNIHKIKGTENFNDASRVWVFQSDRTFDNEELKDINAKLNLFTNSWTSHSVKVKAAAEVFYKKFIVFMADESQAEVGGCSQDSLMRQVQSIQNQFNVNLLDRLSLAIMVNDQLQVYTKDDLIHNIESGIIPRDTLFFDNLVNTKKQFENHWLKPIQNSWITRFLSA